MRESTREPKGELWRAIDEARLQTDRRVAEEILIRPALQLCHVVIHRRAVQLSSEADLEHIESVVAQAMWEAIRRVDLSLATSQVFHYLFERAKHAVSDGARDADPLPRRARAYRRRLLEVASRRGVNEESELRALALELFPRIHLETLELMVRGAPTMMDLERVDPSPAADPDPVDEVVARRRADAVHVALADHTDADLRAWAAAMLSGEHRGKGVPIALRTRAAKLRPMLAGWT